MGVGLEEFEGSEGKEGEEGGFGFRFAVGEEQMVDKRKMSDRT